MNYYVLKVYINFKHKPFYELLFNSKQLLDSFILKFNGTAEDGLIELGTMLIRKKDIVYIEYEEKYIRNR